MSRIRKVCKHCGSVNVRADAYVEWNEESQDWEIFTVYDKGSVCEDCDGECTIVDVSDEEAKDNTPLTREAVMCDAEDIQAKTIITHKTISDEW